MAENRITVGDESQEAPITVVRNIDLRCWDVRKVMLSASCVAQSQEEAAWLVFLLGGICKVLHNGFTKDPDKAFFEFTPGHSVSVAELIAKPSLWPDQTGLIRRQEHLELGESIKGLYRSGEEIVLIVSKELHLGRPLIEFAADLHRLAPEVGCMLINEDLLWPEPLRSNNLVEARALIQGCRASFEEATASKDTRWWSEAGGDPIQQPLLAVIVRFDKPFEEGAADDSAPYLGVFSLEDGQDWEEIAAIHRSWAPSLIQKCLTDLGQFNDELATEHRIIDTTIHLYPLLFVVDASKYTVRAWKRRKR